MIEFIPPDDLASIAVGAAGTKLRYPYWQSFTHTSSAFRQRPRAGSSVSDFRRHPTDLRLAIPNSRGKCLVDQS